MFVILNPFDRLTALSAIEGEVKNLMISTESILEILRLSPQNDITTQSQNWGKESTDFAIHLLQEDILMRYKNNERGFTLIEIMVVVVILGILASYVAVKWVGRTEEARRTQARVQIESLGSALALYKLDNGTYPSTEQGLQALVEPPTVGTLPRKWKEGGYLEKRQVPKDPWGYDYVYLSPGLHDDYDISSYGDDGSQGGEGEDKDVNSWEVEE